MAFVKMSNLLGKTIEVPHGAVRAYQGLGFTVDGKVATEVAKAKGNKAEKVVAEVEDTMTEDERFVHELEKKPLSQWNKDEVKRYATICNIDISGTKNAQEAKERIKTYIDEKAE